MFLSSFSFDIIICVELNLNNKNITKSFLGLIDIYLELLESLFKNYLKNFIYLFIYFKRSNECFEFYLDNFLG